MSAHATLRHSTREAHDALDRRFGGYDLSDRHQYGRFLAAQAAALLPIEAALDHAGAAAHLPGWPAMRRGAAIVADLDALGITLPPPVRIEAILGEPDILGTLYVLEGSRLGGKMLSRQVGDDLPRAFLNHRGPIAWREFLALLEQKLLSPLDLSVARGAALRTFESFSLAAERVSA